AICAQLRELGYDDSLDCSSLFMEIDFDGYDAYMTPEFAARISENYLRNILLHYRRGPLIERLFVMINNKCSLRCKNCDAYIPYVKDAVNYDFGRIVESCQCALDAVGGVDTVDILGGEPMLHDRLSEILRYFIENPSVSRVTLITNGTILPGAELVETMKSPKFVCRLSNYGKHSRRLGEIAALLGANAIRSEMTNYSQWDALPALSATNETRRELDAKFASCTANLFYLQDGKLFYCNVVASLTCNVRTDVLPPSPDDYLDLYEGECGGLRPDAKERIAAFAARLHTRRHIGACKYCTGSHCLQFENKVPVAEQTKERLEMPRAY
ncbi:MAG: radical SAM protein, partial [Clostridiales bacterium]|nr:radical SAM protein [Clostridiales bacterium]